MEPYKITITATRKDKYGCTCGCHGIPMCKQHESGCDRCHCVDSSKNKESDKKCSDDEAQDNFETSHNILTDYERLQEIENKIEHCYEGLETSFEKIENLEEKFNSRLTVIEEKIKRNKYCIEEDSMESFSALKEKVKILEEVSSSHGVRIHRLEMGSPTFFYGHDHDLKNHNERINGSDVLTRLTKLESREPELESVRDEYKKILEYVNNSVVTILSESRERDVKLNKLKNDITYLSQHINSIENFVRLRIKSEKQCDVCEGLSICLVCSVEGRKKDCIGYNGDSKCRYCKSRAL